MRRPYVLPEAVVAEIKTLRAQKDKHGRPMPMDKIAGIVATTRHHVKRALTPGYHLRVSLGDNGRYHYRPPEPPQSTLDERQRAYANYSAMAQLLGDPPPGRSALDRLKKC